MPESSLWSKASTSEVDISPQYLGFLGTGLVVVAYIPQISHLLRARCVAGISLWAYSVWTVSAALLLTYAVILEDSVFISLQIYQLLATASIFILSLRRGVGLCDVHCGLAEPQASRSGSGGL